MPCRQRAGQTARARSAGVLCQAGKELLLMQASDWPFLITSQTARDYAEQRFLTHSTDLKRLLQLARSVRERGRLEADQERFLADRSGRIFCSRLWNR